MGGTLTCNTENGICATATARLVLHYVTYRVQGMWDHSREVHNALWHHLTQQQLDPCTSYKKKLVHFSLYVHGRGDEETEEDVVGGREKERVTEQETEQESVSDWLLLVRKS